MFHWICPECGREIPPSVKECPSCDPQAAAAGSSPNASAAAPATSAVVATPSAAAPAPAPIPTPASSLNPVDPLLGLAQKLREVQASVAVAAPEPPREPEPEPEPVAVAVAELEPEIEPEPAVEAKIEAEPQIETEPVIEAAPVTPEPAPEPFPEPELTPPHLAALRLAGTPLAAPPLAALLHPPTLLLAPPTQVALLAAPEPLTLAVPLAEPQLPSLPEPAPEPELVATPVQPEPEPVAEPAPAAEPEAEPEPLAAGRVPAPQPALTAIAPAPQPLEEPSALPAEPSSAPSVTAIPEPAAPALNFAGLQDSTFLGNRIRPASSTVRIARSEPGPRITLPGPTLPRALNSLEDAGIAKILVDSPRQPKSRMRGWFTGLLVAAVLIASFVGLELYNAPRSAASVNPPSALPKETPSAPASPVPSPSSAVSYPLSKAVEVTGFRFVGGNDKPEVHYLVVNHSGAQLGSVTVYVTVRGAASRPPLYHFSFRSPSLGPYESKEMVSTIDKLLQPAPDWQNLHADVEVGQ